MSSETESSSDEEHDLVASLVEELKAMPMAELQTALEEGIEGTPLHIVLGLNSSREVCV